MKATKQLWALVGLLMLSLTAIAQNTLPSSGNVGIATITPSYPLHVNGITYSEGILNSSDQLEKVLYVPTFPNGTSNQAVDVIIGTRFWGYIELEITGNYANQPTSGKLTKVFALGINPGGAIYTTESRVADAMGAIPDNIAIGDLEWDETNSRYKIPVSHIVSTANAYNIKVTAFSYGGDVVSLNNSLSISSQYTRTALPRNYVYYNNNVGIGTTNPKEKLSVVGNARIEGDITTKKVTVTQSGWPDYVFQPSYKLKPLQEVALFIKNNQHLPGVPSAKEVEEKGISLGDNQAVLLKKIEELTLYIIDMKEEIEKLKKAQNPKQ